MTRQDMHVDERRKPMSEQQERATQANAYVYSVTDVFFPAIIVMVIYMDSFSMIPEIIQ